MIPSVEIAHQTKIFSSCNDIYMNLNDQDSFQNRLFCLFIGRISWNMLHHYSWRKTWQPLAMKGTTVLIRLFSKSFTSNLCYCWFQMQIIMMSKIHKCWRNSNRRSRFTDWQDGKILYHRFMLLFGVLSFFALLLRLEGIGATDNTKTMFKITDLDGAFSFLYLMR